jgi:DNA-binding GntR family transcriptional regulator
MVRTIDNMGATLVGGTNTRTMTLAEQIAERITDSVIAGRYSPGDRLSEQELADLFEVSRGPIREALRILAKEGFVRILPRRGTVVTKLTPREVEDIFQVRACLMGLAGRLTTLRLTPDVRRGMEWSLSQIDRLAAEQDVDEFLRLAYRLSMHLADSSRNEELQAMILSMARRTLSLTYRALMKAANRKTWSENWHAIATAVLHGDADAAEAAARKLVSETGEWATREAERMQSQ